MSKRTFVIFGTLAVLLAIGVPFLAFRSDADEDAAGVSVPASLQEGKELFETNCGTCHTLAAAGTEGNFGPNLDVLLYPQGPPTDESAETGVKQRVLAAVENGIDGAQTPGRMPPGILTGEQASQVAEFVASVGGQ